MKTTETIFNYHFTLYGVNVRFVCSFNCDGITTRHDMPLRWWIPLPIRYNTIHKHIFGKRQKNPLPSLHPHSYPTHSFTFILYCSLIKIPNQFTILFIITLTLNLPSKPPFHFHHTGPGGVIKLNSHLFFGLNTLKTSCCKIYETHTIYKRGKFQIKCIFIDVAYVVIGILILYFHFYEMQSIYTT